MKNKYLLMTTDGYSLDDYTFYDSFETAQAMMKKSYENLTPSNWIDEFKEMSNCGEKDAILYCNGENVYVWNIIKMFR